MEILNAISPGRAGDKEAKLMPQIKTKNPPPDPQTLAAMRLKCVVCTGEIPASRVRRRKDTCSPECYDLLLHFKKNLFKAWQCPTCLAPNTPQQREDYKRWRQETQGRRLKRGKPPVARERKLTDLLTLAVKEMRASYDVIFDSECTIEGKIPDDVAAFDPKRLKALIEKCEAALEIPKPFLVDTPPAERDSISANTETPPQP